MYCFSNQLAEAGISAKRYIAEGLGYGSGDEGIAKLSKDLEGGKIGAEAALKAITEGMKEYKGMMDRTANETVSGLWSQIEDTFEINIFRRWGQGLQDGAKKGIGSVVKLLDEADGALSSFGDTIYEVGKTISNWAADKFKTLVDNITKITDTFEFKNASLGDKISMLWKGAIVDPLKEWWNGGGQQATAETAGKIGKWMGEFITDGLLALFGATNVLDDSLGSDTGKSVAGSFLKGFLDAFDGSAITKAFVDAISNVWSALPWWGKILVGGYAGSKVASGLGGLIGSIGTIGGAIGSAGAGTGLLGYGANAAITLGAGNLAGGASLGAGALSAIGLGATAGGIAAGAGLLHAGSSAMDAYSDYKEGNKAGMKANMTRSGLTLAGIGGGALVGAKAGAAIGAVGGPAGALIGAGLGTAIGWFAGDKIARNIEAAKVESEGLKEAIKDSDKSAEELAQEFEKAKFENASKHFGDIKLSTQEIARLSKQIVFGKDLETFDKFTSATEQAEASLQSLKNASETTDRWMWKAGLGVKFNKNEKKSIKQAFDDYVDSAKAYVENKHYEFTASADLLLDLDTKEGKSILGGGNAFYAAEQEKLNAAGKELGDALSKALEDGIINADEEKAIIAAQEKIASITKKIADAEADAEIELIKVKFGGANIDYESFKALSASITENIDKRVKSADDAFRVQVSTLKLQLENGSIDKDEYEKKLQSLIDGYKAEVEGAKVELVDVQMGIVADSYKDVLGKDGKKKLVDGIQKAMKDGISSAEMLELSDEELAKLLGIDADKLTTETAANLKEILSGTLNQLELMEVDGNLLLKIGEVETEGDSEEKVKNAVDESIPEKVEETIGVDISGEKEILNHIEVVKEDFGLPDEQAAMIAMLLYGDKDILNQIDVSALAAEFGIPESQMKTVIEKLTGEKSIQNKLEILASDFGIKPFYDYSTVARISVKYKISGKMTETGIKGSANKMARQLAMDGFVNNARGGITYPTGYNVKGFAGGGMVRGGARLIRVAEEGTPEMIIPLGLQRRDRALKLWEKAGEMLGVQGFARGGRTDNGDEGLRFKRYGSDEHAGGQSVQVDVGGVNVQIQVDAKGSDNIVDAIKAQGSEIAETVAGIILPAITGQWENTPLRGGA